MRKNVVFICLFLCISLLGCNGESKENTKNVVFVEDESAFVDFYVEDGIVHILCSITLENHTSVKQIVGLAACSTEDVSTGLLRSADLVGYNEENDDWFVINKKSKVTFVVDFQGEYAGTQIKNDRLLPDVIEVRQ